MDRRKALDLVSWIQSDSPYHVYRLAHVKLVCDYMLELNRRLEYDLDESKLELIGLLHDVLKERKSTEDRYLDSHMIPWDLNDYVRRNLGLLGEYGLDEYFNSDIQLHPLAGGIFLRKEFYIDDPGILYPVMFHSCPVIPIYQKLDLEIQRTIDLVMLSDKLSSNWLRINYEGTDLKRSGTPVDLDLLVFGPDGKEFHYSMGLYVAKLLGNAKRMDPISTETTLHYYNRLTQMNPLTTEIKLGGKKEWPKRKNLSLRTL